MSTCISMKGEYGEHIFEGETLGSRFNCARCFVFDEDAADRAVRDAEAAVERVRDLAREWGSAGTVSVYESAGELAQMLNEALAAPSSLDAAENGGTSCGARVATSHPCISQTCARPAGHDGEHDPTIAAESGAEQDG